MRDNWEKYLPAIRSSFPCAKKKMSTDTCSSSFNSLTALEKQFRTGTTAKHTGAYQIYEVKIITVLPD